MLTGAIGIPLAVIVVWVLNTWAMPIDPETLKRTLVPAEVGAALGAVFSGGIAWWMQRRRELKESQ